MVSSNLSLTSSAFKDGAAIPERYSCDGDRELNPPLTISGVPMEAKSLVLIMDDPDIPAIFKKSHNIDVFDHWVLFDISPQTREISEGAIEIGTTGVNSAGKNSYTGPCPPPQYEPSEHRYIFKLYALDAMLGLPAGSSKADVVAAVKGHVLAQTQLIGRYKRR